MCVFFFIGCLRQRLSVAGLLQLQPFHCGAAGHERERREEEIETLAKREEMDTNDIGPHAKTLFLICKVN